MEELMKNLEETVSNFVDDYCIGYEPELGQIIIEVPSLREDATALHELKMLFNKLTVYNGGENLGAELMPPYNDLILYPNLGALKIEDDKNYLLFNEECEE